MLILFPACCDGLLSLSQAIAKPVITSITHGAVKFPHSPYYLNCPVPTVYPEKLVLSRPICFELSAFPYKVKVLTTVVSQSYGKLFQERLWTPFTVP